MTTDVYTEIKQFVLDLIGNKSTAFQFAGDQNGTLAAQGITDGDLSQVDMQQLVGDCIAGADLPESTRQALQSYASGSPASYPVSTPPAYSASQSAADVVQHLNYVTYATYEGDEQITQQLIDYEDYSTNIDNSVDVNVDGDVEGDIDVDTTNVNATGDGAVAAGDDVENAATSGGQVIDGDNYGNANTGDGAVQAGGAITAPVNTGEFTGVQAGRDANENVVGDNNQTANIDLTGGGGGGGVEPILLGARDGTGADAGPININFGGGTQQNIQNSEIDDSAVAAGGSASNVSDIDDGSAVSTGEGDATGESEESHVDAYYSTVRTEQGSGDQEADQETEDVGSA